MKIKTYRTMILLVVVYECEAWFLTLREKHRLKVFENRMLRKIFGPKRHEVTGEWRRLLNNELNDLQSSPNIIQVIKSRRMKWTGQVACMEERTGAYRGLVGQREGTDYFEDLGVYLSIIKKMAQEVEWEGTNLTDLALDRDRWRACECSNKPSSSKNCEELLH
jgi:hypothetical protein